MQTSGVCLADSATLSALLNVDTNFDIVQRGMTIAGRTATLFFLDGFMKDEMFEKVMEYFIKMAPDAVAGMTTAEEFGNQLIPYVEVAAETDFPKIVTAVLSGTAALFLDQLDGAALIDSRTYPTRGIAEPEKDKVMRGSRDGFVETMIFNTAMVRRRIRDPHLCMEHLHVGKSTKLDVTISYMNNTADLQLVRLIREKLENVTVKSISMTQEALTEALIKLHPLNPFPRIKYTERPDYAAACILEGKVVVILDNSPSVMIFPCSFADFQKESNDYYFPPFTGSYMRIIRMVVTLATLLLTPFFLLMMREPRFLPDWLSFIKTENAVMLPLIVQFLLLEFVIDGLRLASLNTPDSLSNSLGIIGGLLLSEFAIRTNWFTPETILYMAFVTIGSFAQPSFEMGYALKFFRVLLLILVQFFGLWGLLGGLLFMLLTLLTTETLTGKDYLYPIFPFNGKAFLKLFFRTKAQ